MAKNEIRTSSHITYKNELKIDYRPKCKTWNHEATRRKYMGKLYDNHLGDGFSRYDSRNIGNKNKHRQMGLCSTRHLRF
jgi:hypothetical protein